MNYFLKKIGYKQDRLSIGLHRLSIALIIISAMYIPIFFHKQSNFFYICIADILIYLFLLYWRLLYQDVDMVFGNISHKNFPSYRNKK